MSTKLPANFKVLLIGNYQPDAQRSMARFAQQLHQGFLDAKIQSELMLPPVLAGALGASPRGLGKWIGYLDKYLLAPQAIRKRIRDYQPSIVHICDHSNAHYVPYIKCHPHLVTCHDLFAIRSAQGKVKQNPTRWSGRQQQSLILAGLSQSRCIVSVSEATANELNQLLDTTSRQTQSVIPNALDSHFIEEAHKPLQESPRPVPYLFHVGGEKWYKNRVATLKVFARLATVIPALELRYLGPPFTQEQLQESNCEHFRERIQQLPPASDDALRAHYQGAVALVFPSICEGFGWPILEAQACGTPVICSATEPMRSLNSSPHNCIQGSPETHEWHQIAAKRIQELTTRPPEQTNQDSISAKAFAAQFTNTNSVAAYLEIYTKLLYS